MLKGLKLKTKLPDKTADSSRPSLHSSAIEPDANPSSKDTNS